MATNASLPDGFEDFLTVLYETGIQDESFPEYRVWTGDRLSAVCNWRVISNDVATAVRSHGDEGDSEGFDFYLMRQLAFAFGVDNEEDVLDRLIPLAAGLIRVINRMNAVSEAKNG